MCQFKDLVQTTRGIFGRYFFLREHQIANAICRRGGISAAVREPGASRHHEGLNWGPLTPLGNITTLYDVQ